MVLLGGADVIADRPLEVIKKVFDSKASSSHYKSIIVPNADHVFNGKEKEFVQEIKQWLETQVSL